MNERLDFTFTKFSRLLNCLLDAGYSFQKLEDFIINPSYRTVILRHDVDRAPFHSLRTANLEQSLGIKGTYYFRIVRQSNNTSVISEIAALGHEIGYHYEDLAMKGGDQENAIAAFKSNLEYFSTFYPVKTICMHGSPASKWDNSDLWKKYNYKDFGILAEPYFDIDFMNLLYLTDTGRSWNGYRTSVRDKVDQERFRVLKEKLVNTSDIINAVRNNELPDRIMLTVHPQRWSDNYSDWLAELVKQSLKNTVKRIMFVR